MYLRNSLDVLKELYGRPDFVRYMKFAPGKHYLRYKDAQGNPKKKTTTSEMWTGTWWWDKQVRCNFSRLISPLTIPTDRARGNSRRRDDHTAHHILGQDSSHCLP